MLDLIKIYSCLLNKCCPWQNDRFHKVSFKHNAKGNLKVRKVQLLIKEFYKKFNEWQ